MMSLQHYLGHQLELPLLGLGLDLANIGPLRFQELEHLMVIMVMMRVMVEMMIVMVIRDQKHLLPPVLAPSLLDDDEDDNVDGNENVVVIVDVDDSTSSLLVLPCPSSSASMASTSGFKSQAQALHQPENMWRRIRNTSATCPTTRLQWKMYTNMLIHLFARSVSMFVNLR